MASEPTGGVGAGDHFAAPQRLEHIGHIGRRDLIRHAPAATAPVQAEDQARVVWRAAMIVRPQAQRTVITTHRRQTALAPRKAGMPDQGAIGEHPQIVGAVPAGQEVIHRKRLPRLCQSGAAGGYCKRHKGPLISRFIPWLE
ncbi:hypothetical protein D3C78_1427240 [compost metagenome]